MEQLAGTAENTLFRNEENGYSVLSLRTKEGPQTVIGILPEFSAGEKITFSGSWVTHPQYGRQFRAASFVVERPEGLDAIERYLASGLIKGVGPSTARLIVETFGQDTLSVLSDQPDRLTEVPKIGKVRMQQISQSFQAQQASRNTYLFLQRYGITPSLSAKIDKLYSDQAENIIRDNPYRLIDDITGVGFLTADRIAVSLGISKDSPFRLRAGIKYALQDAAGGGHTCLPKEMLIKEAARLLNATEELVTVEGDGMCLAGELKEDLVEEEVYVSLPPFRFTEREVSRRLMRLIGTAQEVFPEHIRLSILRFEEENDIQFSQTQQDAVLLAARSGLSVITGGPGTGKTTLINCILHVLGENSKILLAAPTGRAAKRMSEATGREASTLHRLLQYGGEDGAFQMNADNPLTCDCIIVDEVSMMDIFLMRSLLEALQAGTRLILVGDADQLPSVGPGNVLADILACDRIPQVRLCEIFRQAGDSMIVTNAHRINRGEAPVMNGPGSDFFFENQQDATAAAKCIVALCQKRLPKYLKTDDSRGLQVLSPTRKGDCGVHALNLVLQEALNPKQDHLPEIQFGEMSLRPGDKVMHVKNNYQLAWTTPDGQEGQGVFNGDIGMVESIDLEDRLVTVLFDEGRQVVYEYPQLEELELAYCLSVHKSQGSEFPAVIMPMVGGPRMLLTRNLLYTGVTRARQLVVLVGRMEVVRMMVNNNLERRRYSLLTHWLRERGAQTA